MSLSVNALELLRIPGTRREISSEIDVAELGIDDERVSGPASVDLVLVSSVDDVEVSGSVTVAWHDACRRCLTPLDHRRAITLDERYAQQPSEPDTFPIHNGRIDLDEAVRQTVLLAVEDAPLCRPDCEGLCPICGADRSAVTCGCVVDVRDDRWSALDQLRPDS